MDKLVPFDAMSPYALYCKYSALLAAAGSIFPDSSLLQIDLKLSQIIENTSVAIVAGSLNFCEYPVTLLEPYIGYICQFKHCRTYTLNIVQLRLQSVCMWFPATILHLPVSVNYKI